MRPDRGVRLGTFTDIVFTPPTSPPPRAQQVPPDPPAPPMPHRRQPSRAMLWRTTRIFTTDPGQEQGTAGELVATTADCNVRVSSVIAAVEELDGGGASMIVSRLSIWEPVLGDFGVDVETLDDRCGGIGVLRGEEGRHSLRVRARSG